MIMVDHGNPVSEKSWEVSFNGCLTRFIGKVGLAMYTMSTIKRKKKNEKYVNWD